MDQPSQPKRGSARAYPQLPHGARVGLRMRHDVSRWEWERPPPPAALGEVERQLRSMPSSEILFGTLSDPLVPTRHSVMVISS